MHFWPCLNPILAMCKLGQTAASGGPKGGQKSVFIGPQMVWDPQSPQNWPFMPPSGPHLGPFCGHFGPIWGQKTRFSQKNFVLRIIFNRFPDGLGPSKTENCPFVPPNGPQMTYIGFPDGLGPSKNPTLAFYTRPSFGHLLSPRIPLGLAKSSALFKP